MSQIWKTVNIYIDIETGEQLTKEEATNYILKNIKKKLRYDKGGKRYMEQIKEYQKPKYRQGEIPYSD